MITRDWTDEDWKRRDDAINTVIRASEILNTPKSQRTARVFVSTREIGKDIQIDGIRWGGSLMNRLDAVLAGAVWLNCAYHGINIYSFKIVEGIE